MSQHFLPLDAQLAFSEKAIYFGIMRFSWGMDKRITDYLKVWKRLRIQGRYDLEHFDLGCEYEFQWDDVSCFGACAQVALEHLNDAFDLMFDNRPISFLILTSDIDYREYEMAKQLFDSLATTTPWKSRFFQYDFSGVLGSLHGGDSFINLLSDGEELATMIYQNRDGLDGRAADARE